MVGDCTGCKEAVIIRAVQNLALLARPNKHITQKLTVRFAIYLISQIAFLVTVKLLLHSNVMFFGCC